MKNVLFVLFLVALLLVSVGCEKKKEAITDMDDLKVAEDFTFRTVKEVQVVLNSVNSAKTAVPNAPFMLKRGNGAAKLVIDAATNGSGVFDHVFSIPSYENKLYLIVDGQSYTLNIPSDGIINYTFTGSSSKSRDTWSCYTPAQDQFATLAWEDMWPTNGDYDINDLVIDINTEEIYDAETWSLSTIKFKFKIRAIGARRNIGFGITLPEYISASGSPISTTTNPQWRSEYNSLVFFNNARDLVNDDPTKFFNSDHTIPHNSDSELVFEIELPATETWEKQDSGKMIRLPWYSAPFNPYIFINNQESYQIHLKQYPVNPNYANMSLFNTEDDNSDVSDPEWAESYQNYNYCPWGFYIAESTVYPLEKIDILEVFPTFADWALSGGWEYEDWYQNYNSAFIYNPAH